MSQIASFVLRLVLLPFVVLAVIGRIAGRMVGRGLEPVLVRIDRSPGLSKLINSLSSSMATQRGLLLMIGTGVIVLSLLVHAIILFALAATDVFDRYIYLLCIPFALLHIGILAGFIGVMIAVPLGQGYKSQQQ